MKKVDEECQTIDLKREYRSIYGAPVIRNVDPSIFRTRYFTNCMTCSFCRDACCSYGADIDMLNVQRVMQYADKLGKYVNTPVNGWFTNDNNFSSDYPCGEYTRTRAKDGACVFLDRLKRGCLIHRFCLENGMDYHALKPMICTLFPVSFDEGFLEPSYEILEDSLVCSDQGHSLYRGVRDELLYYFGLEFVEELDFHEKGDGEFSHGRKRRGSTSLTKRDFGVRIYADDCQRLS